MILEEPTYCKGYQEKIIEIGNFKNFLPRQKILRIARKYVNSSLKQIRSLKRKQKELQRNTAEKKLRIY